MPNLKINIFSGGNAFSSATAAKLTDEFNFSNSSKATIECIEVFLVSAEDSCNELDRCKTILGCEELAEEFDFFVGPRRSTISPGLQKLKIFLKMLGLLEYPELSGFMALRFLT